MQNPTVIRTRSKVATPARELPWTFLLLAIVCACVVAVGFFFAARQHFNAMDYSIKNSNLREQLRNLETEKRRLLLAREVASSPLAIRKAAMGLRDRSENAAAVQVVAKAPATKSNDSGVEPTKTALTKSSETHTVVRTAMTAPVQTRSTGETRGRVVETKEKKTEVAALLKLK